MILEMASHVERVGRSAVGKKGLRPFSADLDFKKDILNKYGSIESLKAKAEFGQDNKAQVDLAMVYEYGIPELNIAEDLDEAIRWYETCHKSDTYGTISWSSNLSSLGALHSQKDSVSHQKRAIELFLEAANFGNTLAELNLAEAYRCGVEGVINKNLEEAFMWYKRAAGEEHGVIQQSVPSWKGTPGLNVNCKFKALKKLHKFYLCGDCPEGEPQLIKALYYLKKAADRGDPEAQKDYGLTYLTGESGIPKDFDKAKRWLQKAAKNGNDLAQKTLKEMDKEDVFEDLKDGDQNITESDINQYWDIMTMDRLKYEELHSFIIQNPQVFTESTFRQYPDSPTAQRYLKAYVLLREGLEKLTRSNFTDPEGITLLAQGVLYENSITQSFARKINYYRDSIKTLILSQQGENPHFFEGSVFLIFNLMPLERKKGLQSSKLDFRKVLAITNLIKLIKIAEPNKPPKVDPYSYEDDYSSWLHVLYYFLASLYTISECFRDGAGAFQNALQCCPNYYEAKTGLAFCLSQLSIKEICITDLSLDEKLLESFEPPKNQRIPKGDFLVWTKEQKIKKAKELFMEYLEEAPECDKKYPDSHYHLAYLYCLEGDIQECKKWKEKGEDSEEKRLPFMELVDAGSKKLLAMLDMFPTKKMIKKNKCNNKKCKKEGDDVKLICPCHKATYCGSECQKADWKEHKKTCTWKKKKDKLKKDKQSI